MIRLMAILCAAVIVSCLKPETIIETDAGGQGDFIIVNHSSYDIKAVLYFVHQLGSGIDTSDAIRVDSTKNIYHGVAIGLNITPAQTMEMLEIYRIYPDSIHKVYTQYPIDESKWQMVKNYSGDFGNTTNTFEFTGSN
jgi:hypothetical protein